MPTAVRDADEYRQEILENVDWYILYGLLGNDDVRSFNLSYSFPIYLDFFLQYGRWKDSFAVASIPFVAPGTDFS